MKKLIITTRKLKVGHLPGYQLRDNNDDQVADEGFLYDTRKQALEALYLMYPVNSSWQGKRTKKGWEIIID